MPILKPRTLNKTELAALVPLVDEYGEIRARIALAQADVKRAEVLRAKFLEAAGEFPPDENKVLFGKAFNVDIGARTSVTRLDVVKILAKIGVHRFLRICSVTQAALKQVMSGEEAAKFMSAAQTGPRIVKAIPGSDS